MTPPRLVDGQLPHGRWMCTVDDVEAVYVSVQPGEREAIWSEWQSLTGAVREVVGEIAACWMSGSFFTDKPDPADIDCLYVIDAARLIESTSTNPVHHAFLDVVGTSRVKSQFKLRVDSYILAWVPTPGPGKNAEAGGYFEWRGYWDDLWSRVRDDDPRLDSIPRRGYLEVHLDGYQ